MAVPEYKILFLQSVKKKKNTTLFTNMLAYKSTLQTDQKQIKDQEQSIILKSKISIMILSCRYEDWLLK